MAAFDFPPTPAVGTLYPAVAEVGKPQYRWNGSEWVAATFDPAGYVRKSGDAMTGALSLVGDPTQALHAVPKQYLDAKKSTLSLAGGKSFDVQVPDGATAVALRGVVWATTATNVVVRVHLSVSPGVFRTTSGDYSLNGFNNISNAATVVNSSAIAETGILVANSLVATTVPLHFDGVITLKRPITVNSHFSGSFRGASPGASGYAHGFYYTAALAAAFDPGLSVIAFRVASNVGDNWGPYSHLNIEWIY